MQNAFDATVCGIEAGRGKPFPDIFLLAAKTLGVAPEACVVLEDSPNGIAAAHAAQMTGIWIPDQITPEERPDTAELADMIFPTLEEAACWLKERKE